MENIVKDTMNEVSYSKIYRQNLESVRKLRDVLTYNEDELSQTDETINQIKQKIRRIKESSLKIKESIPIGDNEIFNAYNNDINEVTHDSLYLNMHLNSLLETIDTKTNCYSQKGFDGALKSVFAEVKEGARNNMAVIVFDQNNLKDTNEKFGHDVGQASILKFGELLKEELKKKVENTYVLSNYFGGDEWFLIIEDIKSEKDLKKIINEFLLKTSQNKYDIDEAGMSDTKHIMSLPACAGITFLDKDFFNDANAEKENVLPGDILKMADIKLLETKLRRSKGELSAFSSFDHFTIDDYNSLKDQQYNSVPEKYQKELLKTYDINKLREIRSEERTHLSNSRTLSQKNIHNHNLDLAALLINDKVNENFESLKESIISEMILKSANMFNSFVDSTFIDESAAVLGREQFEKMINDVVSKQIDKHNYLKDI